MDALSEPVNSILYSFRSNLNIATEFQLSYISFPNYTFFFLILYFNYKNDACIFLSHVL